MTKYISAAASATVIAALVAAQDVHDKALAKITSLQDLITSSGVTVDTTEGDDELNAAVATFNDSVAKLTDAINAPAPEPAATVEASDAPVATGVLNIDAPAYSGVSAS